jgi:hypothetical protein
MINNAELIFIEEKTFNNNVYTKDPLTKGEYEKCTFLNCDFPVPAFPMSYLPNVSLLVVI